MRRALGVVGAACVARCFQSAAPRAAGCIYREISGLPLAQWAPLVLGLSLSRQAGKRLSKQLSLSAPVTARATNCMGTERGGGRDGWGGGSHGGTWGGGGDEIADDSLIEQTSDGSKEQCCRDCSIKVIQLLLK